MTPLFKRRLTVLAVVATLMIIADQLTKFIAVKHLTPAISEAVERKEIEPGFLSELGHYYRSVRAPCLAKRCEEVTVVNGFWTFHYRENRGAAFSMLAKAPDSVRMPFFILSTIVALGFIVAYLKKLGPEKKVLAASLILVAAGAGGNLIDRLYLGYVVDFIHWFVGDYHWPTFNVADSAITVGAVLMAIDAFFIKEPKEAATPATREV